MHFLLPLLKKITIFIVIVIIIIITIHSTIAVTVNSQLFLFYLGALIYIISYHFYYLSHLMFQSNQCSVFYTFHGLTKSNYGHRKEGALGGHHMDKRHGKNFFGAAMA